MTLHYTNKVQLYYCMKINNYQPNMPTIKSATIHVHFHAMWEVFEVSNYHG
jgi:hypothetical protein